MNFVGGEGGGGIDLLHSPQLGIYMGEICYYMFVT